MLRLVLAEAELEPVPNIIAGHPAVVKNAKKRGKRPSNVILDANLHHSAMHGLPEWQRRGRPDIAHAFLLLALDSIANQNGEIEVYVHTRNDEIITISPETRLPKGYNRFIGLMESLFLNRVVPSKEAPLLSIRQKSLPDFLNELKDGDITVLHPQGESVKISGYMRELDADTTHTFVIGGFAEGDFHTDFSALSCKKISIFQDLLKVWTVTSEIIVCYEAARGMI